MPGFNRYACKLCLIALALGEAEAQAAEWSTNAGVGTSVIYTDNVCLANTNEEDNWVGTLSPNMGLEGSGARANMSLAATVSYNTLAANSPNCSRQSDIDTDQDLGDLETFNPQLRFTGDLILIEDWLYFDATAFVDQNKVNEFAPGGDDNLNGTENTNTTVSYTVGASVRRRFKDIADLTLTYNTGDQYNTANVLNNSTQESWVLDISSGNFMPKLTVGIGGNYRKVDYDDGDNSDFASISVRAAYQINRSWQVNGVAGDEFNDFNSFDKDSEGFFWDVGGLWTPNNRISIGAGYGERFYGNTKRFNADYSHKRSSLRASYTESISFNADLRTLDEFPGDVDDPGFPLTGIPPGFGGAPTTLSDEPFLDERFTLDYGFTGRRTSLNVRGSYSKQTQAGDGINAEFINIGIGFSRSLSSKLSMDAGVDWDDRKANNDGNPIERDSHTWRYTLGLNRPISTDTSASVNYQYSRRYSDFSIDEYDENRITFTLSHTF